MAILFLHFYRTETCGQPKDAFVAKEDFYTRCDVCISPVQVKQPSPSVKLQMITMHMPGKCNVFSPCSGTLAMPEEHLAAPSGDGLGSSLIKKASGQDESRDKTGSEMPGGTLMVAKQFMRRYSP